MRSRAAAGILEGAGFTRVAGMAGGIHAWNGHIAAGPPDAGIALFPATASPRELAALAWYLEAGSHAFYAGLAGLAKDAEASRLFEQLERAENSHLRSLEAVNRDLAGGGDAAAFPWSVVGQHSVESVMEGGVEVENALSWARGREAFELLEYTMGLETNSWDLYLRMRRAVTDIEARRVFEVLAEEEKRHLDMLTRLLEDRHGR